MRDNSSKALELLETSGPGLFALMSRLTLREDIAEDLMQELFIKLNNSQILDSAANPLAYARKAAINIALDWRRSKHISRRLDEVREPASNDSPLAKLIQDEELESILNAIGRLNNSYRQAVVMRYIEQESYEQIAEELDKTPHHVRALCSKGLRQIRESLNGARTSRGGKGVPNG